MLLDSRRKSKSSLRVLLDIRDELPDLGALPTYMNSTASLVDLVLHSSVDVDGTFSVNEKCVD